MRFLTSMNLAVTLLVMLAIAAVIGTIVPQNQPVSDYILRFGPFWAELFGRLGVFNVYGSLWFTALLLFLVFSLSLCVIEQAVGILQRRSRKDSASAIRFNQATELSCSTNEERLIEELRSSGLKVRTWKDEKGVIIRARKGQWRTPGYFLLHGGLLVILAGALIDTNPLVRLKLISGEIEPAPMGQMPDQAPGRAVLPPDSGAFRTVIHLKPGEKTDRVYLSTSDGYLIRKLPFVIAVDDFRIDYYASGMPKGYTTSVSLFSPDGRLLTQDAIAVNSPLTFQGYTLYQSSFSDGGSLITFRAIRPGAKTPLHQRLRVGESIDVNISGKRWRLELLEFHLHTVVNRAGGGTLNHGPRMAYRLIDPQGRQIWMENYLNARQAEGIQYAITRFRPAPAMSTRTLAIPLHEGDDKPFWRWLSRLTSMTGNNLESLLVQLFTMGGFNEIENFIEKKIEERQRREIKKIYINILLNTLDESLRESIPEAQSRWRNEAIMAADALFAHQIPVWLQMERFEQKLETGLIVAHAPGKTLIWLGSMLLTAGIFLMLYTHPVQIWIHLPRLPSKHPMKMVIKCKDKKITAAWSAYILGLCKGHTNEHHGHDQHH